MDEAEYQSKLNPPTQILPTVVQPEGNQFVAADGATYLRIPASEFNGFDDVDSTEGEDFATEVVKRFGLGPTSQNGWPANNRSLVASFTIPGSTRKIALRIGDCSVVLLDILAWIHAHVRKLDTGQLDDWGYAERTIRGSPTDLSNHASGTAADVDALLHPLGVKGTWLPAERDAIHGRLGLYEGVVRWGLDYDDVARGGVRGSRVDEMHFELNAGSDAVARVARKLRGNPPQPAPPGGPVSDVWARKEGPWEGGITDIPDPVKGEKYDLFQTVKRNNVTTYQTALMVEELLNRRAVAPQVKLDVDRLANTLAEHPAIAALKAPEPELDVVDEVVSVPFWKAAAERAGKTVVQTLLVLAVPSSGLFNAFSMDWRTTGGLALSAGLLSILTSLASAPIGGTDSPSLLKGGGD